MGLILPQEVEVKWNGTSRQYYRDKGYTCDVYGESILVNVLDLSHSSSVRVAVKCDFCERIESISWKGYLKLQGNKYCCPECLKHKKKERDKNGNLIFIDVSYRDKDWLYNEYIIKDKDAKSIANEFDINQRTLRQWITNFNLADKIGSKTKCISNEELVNYYVNQKLTTLEIGKIYGLSDGTILSLLNKYNIEIPNRSELMHRYYYEKGGLDKAIEIANRLEKRIKSSCRDQGISIEDFNGFLSDENHLFRNSSKYDNWRKSVFERDGYTCQCCGKRGGNLQAHHIENFSTEIDKRLDIDNGITMCWDCHAAGSVNSFHRIYGYKNNNREQLNEYITNKKLSKESEEINGKD